MGMSAQQMLQNDPEYLARQLAQQEIQRYQNFQNPQIGLASTSGAILGRGLANLFGGRGFFEVSDPALRRVADTQRVFNEAMANFDPENPAASYEAMSRRFSELGFGQQAMMAAQEANKYRQQAREFGLKERAVSVQEEQVNVSKEKLQMEIDDAARKNKLTEAQIKQIDAQIANISADKYTFQPQKDALGNLISVIAINKTNPSDVKTIQVAPQTSTTGGDGLPSRSELEAERNKRRGNESR